MKESPFPKRLKEARLEANLSQAVLGELAGISPEVSSARMNQYEKGVHTPSYPTIRNIAKVLNVPIAYFFVEEEDFALFIKRVHRLTIKHKKELYNQIDSFKN